MNLQPLLNRGTGVVRFSRNGKAAAFLKMKQPVYFSTMDPVKAAGKIPEVCALGRWTVLGFINHNNQLVLTFDTSEGVWRPSPLRPRLNCNQK